MIRPWPFPQTENPPEGKHDTLLFPPVLAFTSVPDPSKCISSPSISPRLTATPVLTIDVFNLPHAPHPHLLGVSCRCRPCMNCVAILTKPRHLLRTRGAKQNVLKGDRPHLLPPVATAREQKEGEAVRRYRSIYIRVDSTSRLCLHSLLR
jgi:hypothetical protein